MWKLRSRLDASNCNIEVTRLPSDNLCYTAYAPKKIISKTQIINSTLHTCSPAFDGESDLSADAALEEGGESIDVWR
jgi:hypothetical protein